jgi:hypothetical protein
VPITNISIYNSTNKKDSYQLRALPSGKAMFSSYKGEDNQAIRTVPFIGVKIENVLGPELYSDQDFTEDLDHILSRGLKVADGYEVI